jgi:hypothetical protein
MNSVTGKVIAAPSNVGIPDLLVTLYNLPPDVKPTNVLSTHGATAAASAFTPSDPTTLGDRVGSVLTSKDGSFTISYDDADLATVDGAPLRRNLILLVTSPEDGSKGVQDRILFASTDVRRNAGRAESFHLRIEESALKGQGVPAPTVPMSTIARDVDTYRAAVADAQTFSDVVLDVQRARVQAREAELRARKAAIRPLFTLAAPPAPGFTTHVGESETVGAKLPLHVQSETSRVNALLAQHASAHRGVEVKLLLTAADRAALGIDVAADGLVTLTRTQFDQLRFKGQGPDADGLVLTSDNPILNACLRRSADTERARQVLDGEAPATTPPPPASDPSPTGPVTADEILTLVRRALLDQRLATGAPVRADAGSVDAAVSAFALRRGPAELPSLHDFKTLQIAFGHVWQQLVDDTPASLAAEAGHQAAQLGYTVDFSAARSPRDLLGTVLGTLSVQSSPPAAVVAAFDVTKEEWNACDPAHQHKLESLAADLAKARTGLVPDRGLPSLFRVVSPMMAEQFAQSLKEQGELIIDYVRYSNDRSFHKILTELDHALRANYAFTIFGADASAKAVNFGLLNTYRQRWEPTAYQVGDLVKSIPLAPKEERKYSLKTTFTRKRAEKEALKNNTSLTQQQNTTTRAEAEIVAKAQSKSDFKLNAEANFSKWKVSSSLGLEAEKESQDTRKDFRESVLQATHEFKEERSVDVTSEESFGSESEASGTVVNPNDELAVTYLFYELQRRCKVSEQLYRTMPVVLVAQDVPSPHEITEAWIVAHDWMLNRALLDDSFRPALQYLAQKNVGDDFAVRELRRNLRTQRQLVESLKRELTILRKETDNRYVALESAINNRIHQETDRETDSFWDDVGEFFGGAKESPEGAKSRELAAKDAHAYAVERSEKLSAAVQREVGTLHQLTDEYNKVMRDHLDKKTMVARLQAHIKNNIIYYLQAVWSLEPPDQRFMRLINTEVPSLELDDGLTCDVRMRPDDDLFAQFRDQAAGETLHRAWVNARLRVGAPRRLIEVADLSTLLGFQGNYMVFPLKRHNALTELMAMPYVDASFGAMDPDQLSNISLEDYARYVCCLRERLSGEEFDALAPTLRNWLQLLLADPLRNGDEVVIPTGSLYIEVMVSANTLLEDFKIQHRALDVAKVDQEVRMQALENQRYAKRLLLDELDDPRVDKQVAVHGLPIAPSVSVDGT